MPASGCLLKACTPPSSVCFHVFGASSGWQESGQQYGLNQCGILPSVVCGLCHAQLQAIRSPLPETIVACLPCAPMVQIPAPATSPTSPPRIPQGTFPQSNGQAGAWEVGRFPPEPSVSRPGRGSPQAPLPDKTHSRHSGRETSGTGLLQAFPWASSPSPERGKALTSRAQAFPLPSSEHPADGIRCVPHPSSGEVHLQSSHSECFSASGTSLAQPSYGRRSFIAFLRRGPRNRHRRLTHLRQKTQKASRPGPPSPRVSLGTARVLWPGSINLADLRQNEKMLEDNTQIC